MKMQMKNENYFTIQLIFTNIYGLTTLFSIIYEHVLFQLIFTFINSTFSNNFLLSAKINDIQTHYYQMNHEAFL